MRELFTRSEHRRFFCARGRHFLAYGPPGGPGSSCGLDAKVCFLYVECVNEYFPCYKRNNSFLQPRVLAPFPPKVRYQTMRSPGIKTVGDEKSKTWRVQQHIFTTNFFITICCFFSLHGGILKRVFEFLIFRPYFGSPKRCHVFAEEQ